MSHPDQIAAFESELDALVARYAREFELPVASVIGCLQLKSHRIAADAVNDAEE